MTEPLTSLAEAIKARPRVCHDFEVNGFLGLGGSPVRQIKVRVPTKREQDLAVVGAHDYVTKLSEKTPAAAADPDILLDAKSAFVAHVAVRDFADPDKLSAFPSPLWMLEELTSEQIGVLVNFVNEVRRVEGPGPDTIDQETVDAYSAMAAGAAGTDIPERVLAGCNREVLAQMFILQAVMLKDALAKAEPPAKPPEEAAPPAAASP